MKYKISSIFALFLILISYICIHFYLTKPKEYKILKVLEADKFFVDFNSNNNADSDELVTLRDVIGITPVKNPYTSKIASSLDIDILDYLKTGYIARNWAKDNFEGKNIKILTDKYEYSKYGKYRVVEGLIENINPAYTLINNGFAVPHHKINNFDLIQYFNPNKIKRNSNKLSELNFVFHNSYSGKIHKLNCEHVKDISYGEILLDKKDYDIFPKCKICFLSNVPDVRVADNFLKNLHNYPKSVYKKFDEIELYLINPYEYPYPNNKTEIIKRIINEINSAKNTIDIALYGFGTQIEIFNALKNAKARGVQIRTVLDYSRKINEVYPKTFEFSKEFSSRFDNSENLMHNKFFIFDNKKVLTGSMNISTSGSGGYNANTVLIFNSEKIAKYYKDEFEQMYKSKFQKNKKKLNKSPVELSDSTVSIYFSPKDDIYNLVLENLIKSAKDEIFVSIFYLTHKSMVNELINAKSRGVKVAVLMDSLGAFQFKNLVYQLRNAGIPVKVENWGGKNHEKTVMIDSKILFTGSSNFSKNGFQNNDENIVVIYNPKIALFWRDYFLYLFNKIDDKYLYKIPRAEGFESGNSCKDGLDNNFDGKIDSEDDGCILKK